MLDPHKYLTLQQRWLTLLDPYFSVSQIHVLWDELHNLYNQQDRYYHNLQHLEKMFGWFDLMDTQLNYPLAVGMAIFYHDAIYKVTFKNNEERSAKLAIKRLYASDGNSFENFAPREIVYALIVSTKNHIPAKEAPPLENQFLLDADLSILGSPSNEYHAYCLGIRREYSFYPDFIYIPRRKKVLQKFLERPRLFHLDAFHAKLDEQARENLSWELRFWG